MFTIVEVVLFMSGLWLYGNFPQPWCWTGLGPVIASACLVFLDVGRRYQIRISLAEGASEAAIAGRRGVVVDGENTVAVNVYFPVDLPPLEVTRSLSKVLSKLKIDGRRRTVRKFGWLVWPADSPRTGSCKTSLAWVTFK